ncbi:MAG TPA: zinc-binding dehydrogenase [Acidimicrobiales bacterium]|nr:zinc-binding dehydrogenase [Acidimicrobiales bacterium]
MRAVLTRTSGLEVVALEDPIPQSGQVLVRTLACGICGSDLHAAQNLGHFAELTARAGGPVPLDPELGAVFGHEFCGEVLAYGPDTAGSVPVGSLVCSVPIIFGPSGPEAIGYSNRFPGGLAELMLLQELVMIPVPEGLAADRAALTEPLSVGEHAVNLAGLSPGDVGLVIGAGPVGLAVIAALKARGHGPVIAADFSPTRRHLAEAMGADEVIDPAQVSPYSRWADLGVPATMIDRAAQDMFGGSGRNAVIFEAVGAPGVLQAIIDGAPPKGRVVVVGVCMRADAIEPFLAVTKELEVRFSFGYSAAEFALTLDRLGRDEIPVDELVTDVVGLDAVPDAFATLSDPGSHGKILVRH